MGILNRSANRGHAQATLRGLAACDDVFCRWFDYRHHSMLIDLCDEPLIAESD